MNTTNRLLKLSDNFDAWRDKLNTQATHINDLFSIVSPAVPLNLCDEIEIGNFVAINTNTSSSEQKKYIKATKPKTILGVYYSTCNDTVIIDNTATKNVYALICTTGIVNAKVSGAISVGDELVLSTTAGVARKYNSGSDNTRNIIGYALETNASTSIKLVKVKI